MDARVEPCIRALEEAVCGVLGERLVKSVDIALPGYKALKFSIDFEETKATLRAMGAAHIIRRIDFVTQVCNALQFASAFVCEMSEGTSRESTKITAAALKELQAVEGCAHALQCMEQGSNYDELFGAMGGDEAEDTDKNPIFGSV